MKLGLCMEGMEDYIEQVIRRPRKELNYLEIGVAYGETLGGLSKVISAMEIDDWMTIGIDPQHELLQIRFFEGLKIISHADSGQNPEPRSVNHYPYPIEECVWIANATMPMHVVLIDGCHSRKCATDNFLTVEPLVPVGGTVMFHDYGERNAGQNQPHCNALVDVTSAVEDLGLMDGKRPGWSAPDMVHGDSSILAVFNRI